MRSRLAFLVVTFVVFTIGTVAWLWPLLPVARTSFPQAFADPTPLGRADAMLISWMLAWGSHALGTNPLGLFHANILHPLPWTFAFSENMLAGVLLISPFHLLSSNPVLASNVLLASTFVLTGVGTALLVRELGGGILAACVAGVIFAFNPFRFGSIGHLQTMSTHWIPFAMLAVHRCFRTGRGAPFVFVSVLLVLLSSVYYLYFFTLALGVFVVAHWLFGAPAAPGGRIRVVGAMGLAALATVPLLVPYAIARDIYALGRSSGEAWFFGSKATMYLGAVAHPLAYALRRYVVRDNMLTVIGLATLVPLVVGLVAGAPATRGGRRTTAAYLAMATAMALVSLGPLMQWDQPLDPGLPGIWVALDAYVPGFSALRVPMRASMLVVLGVAVIAGLGVEALWRRSRTTLARAATVGLVAVVAVAEAWRPPLLTTAVPWAVIGIPPVYRWLATTAGPGAVVELPFGLALREAAYTVYSTVHWRRLVNGYSGFAPAHYYFRSTLLRFPNDESLRTLHAIGVRWIVVHPPDMGPPGAALCEAAPGTLGPHLAQAYKDIGTCVLELRSAPPEPPAPPPDREIALDGATAVDRDGGPVAAAIDRRVDTHWTEAVDVAHESWLQIDLPAPHAITRVVVELGSHFGEYLRTWRVDASLDGTTWTPAGSAAFAVPPLVALRTTPDRLTTELRLREPTPARHLRIVRADGGARPPADLAGNWMRWGVHEVRVFEPSPPAVGLPAAGR